MSIESTAANIRGGKNPEYSKDDFLEMYPQFANVNAVVIDTYLTAAHASILESRWHSKWKLAIGLYVAHFVTLWAMTAAEGALPLDQIAKKGESSGTISSKAVDGVSVSYGQTSADSDLAGWGSFKDTLYGQQLATLAKLIGKGGMYVR